MLPFATVHEFLVELARSRGRLRKVSTGGEDLGAILTCFSLARAASRIRQRRHGKSCRTGIVGAFHSTLSHQLWIHPKFLQQSSMTGQLNLSSLLSSRPRRMQLMPFRMHLFVLSPCQLLVANKPIGMSKLMMRWRTMTKWRTTTRMKNPSRAATIWTTIERTDVLFDLM